MDALEEIRAIKQLLDKGEITEEEFQLRKRKILSNTAFADKSVPEAVVEKKPEPEKHTIPVEEPKVHEEQETYSSKSASAVTPETSVAEKHINPDKVYAAGKSIISSVTFTVLSAFSGFLSALILVLAFGDIMASVSRGGRLPDESGLGVAAIFAGLSVLFWTISIAKLSGAGHSLKQSVK
jgi:VIT1/CCC1 family predicted Fe2+/Mn2+ transporter